MDWSTTLGNGSKGTPICCGRCGLVWGCVWAGSQSGLPMCLQSVPVLMLGVLALFGHRFVVDTNGLGGWNDSCSIVCHFRSGNTVVYDVDRSLYLGSLKRAMASSLGIDGVRNADPPRRGIALVVGVASSLVGRKQIGHRTAVIGLVTLAGPAISVWRLMTYGAVLPNTFYAKAQVRLGTRVVVHPIVLSNVLVCPIRMVLR